MAGSDKDDKHQNTMEKMQRWQDPKNWKDLDLGMYCTRNEFISPQQLLVVDAAAVQRAVDTDLLAEVSRNRVVGPVKSPTKASTSTPTPAPITPTSSALNFTLTPTPTAMQKEALLKAKEYFDSILLQEKFAKQDEKILPMRKLLRKGKYYLCLAGHVENPGMFYVNCLDSWNSLELLMEEMQFEYQEYDARLVDISKPWRGHLQPGYYVAARYEQEMHRARIVNVMENEGNYLVRLVDYGNKVVVPYTDIRYLLNKFVTKLRAQAIRVAGQLGPYYNCNRLRGPPLNYNRGIGWKHEEVEIFRNMVFDKTLSIHFREQFKSDEGEVGWEVFVHLFDKKAGSITAYHLERQVLIKTHKKYNINSEEHTDSPMQNVTITHLTQFN